jgi:hypothetical protein
MNNEFDAKLILVAVFLATILAFVCGVIITDGAGERRAVRAGHATWVAMPDGSSAFRWKEACK